MMTADMFQQFLAHLPKQPTLSQKEAESFYTLGFSLYGTGSFTEAADVFKVLCIRKPLEYRHWFGLASSLQESKDYEKALNAWAMAAILDQSNPHPHFHAAECCFSLNQIEEAQIALQAALTRAEDYPILQDQITLLQKQWNEALC